MKKSVASLFLLSYLAGLQATGVANGESVVAESIETVLGSSDQVVIGKVTKIDKLAGLDTKDYQVVTVAVSKTLKGKHSDQVTFVIYKGHAPQWQEEGIPIIFCLMKNTGKQVSFPADKFEWLIRSDGYGPSTILLGKSKHYWTHCRPVFTRDFAVLTDREDIVKFVEATLKAAPKDRVPPNHSLAVPGKSAAYKKLWSGSSVFLIVPIDEKLEVLGRRWCKSTSSSEREQGARILGFF